MADLFGGSAGGGLYDFAASLGAPLALKDLGLAEADLDRAADLAVEESLLEPAAGGTGGGARSAAARLGWRPAGMMRLVAKRETGLTPRRRRGTA